MKELVIVGGPNGTGKTTFAEEYIGHYEMPYLSADDIAKQLSPEDPTQAQIQAGREFLRQVHQAIGSGENLLVESTLSGRTFQKAIESARRAGYTVRIFYLWLESIEVSLERVRERVRKGGHDVPEIDVRRRFVRSNSNFWNLYRPLSDHWVLTLNSGTQSQDVAFGAMADVTIKDESLFSQFQGIVAQVQ